MSFVVLVSILHPCIIKNNQGKKDRRPIQCKSHLLTLASASKCVLCCLSYSILVSESKHIIEVLLYTMGSVRIHPEFSHHTNPFRTCTAPPGSLSPRSSQQRLGEAVTKSVNEHTHTSSFPAPACASKVQKHEEYKSL